jgi:type I protein arginine methyltransferase
MYSLSGHGMMVADEVRTDAYAKALERTVRPGSIVLDIGAGSGIMSLLACQLGAGEVYAIEPDGVIEIARELARDNGYGDRIRFIRDLSTRVTLPKRVDVIVSDLRGVLPLFESHLSSLADARERFLKPGGAMIPARDTLWASVVEAPEAHAEFVGPWNARCHGLSLDAALRFATNSWAKLRIREKHLLAEPQCWAELDYSRALPNNHKGTAEFRIVRPGTAHGMLVWFDTVLIEDVRFSNAPGQPAAIYGAAFFPWPTEVALEEGDTVRVNLRADLVGEDYEWGWDSRAHGTDPNKPKAEFTQSTFFGKPLSPATLQRREQSFRPAGSEDGEIDRLVLERMDGAHSLGDIAQELTERFPNRFRSKRDALTRASELSEKYSRRD